jgi:formylglycine-generating enzyme required for sulfatase activity
MTGKEPVYRNKNDNSVLRDSRHKGSTVSQSTANDVEKLVIDDKAKIALYNGYRLPTETEWEYAARGGVPSNIGPWAYNWAGVATEAEAENLSWNITNPIKKTRPVAEKPTNSAGLYDMNGNVYEWCFDDCYSGAQRVIRGGCYFDDITHCSVFYRNSSAPSTNINRFGFRVVYR